MWGVPAFKLKYEKHSDSLGHLSVKHTQFMSTIMGLQGEVLNIVAAQRRQMYSNPSHKGFKKVQYLKIKR